RRAHVAEAAEGEDRPSERGRDREALLAAESPETEEALPRLREGLPASLRSRTRLRGGVQTPTEGSVALALALTRTRTGPSAAHRRASGARRRLAPVGEDAMLRLARSFTSDRLRAGAATSSPVPAHAVRCSSGRSSRCALPTPTDRRRDGVD